MRPAVRRAWPALFTIAGLAIAAISDNPALGLPACVVATVGTASLAGRVALPHDARPSPLREAVVLGLLAYLVGLPLTWMVVAHVRTAVASRESMWIGVMLVTLLALFATAYVSSRRRG